MPYMYPKVLAVGDGSSGKTALLHVFTKDAPGRDMMYMPSVFEICTADFEVEGQFMSLTLYENNWNPGNLAHRSTCTICEPRR
jgi:GTPase SAR1 family protein